MSNAAREGGIPFMNPSFGNEAVPSSDGFFNDINSDEGFEHAHWNSSTQRKIL